MYHSRWPHTELQLKYSLPGADQGQDLGLWGELPLGPSNTEQWFLHGRRTTEELAVLTFLVFIPRGSKSVGEAEVL